MPANEDFNSPLVALSLVHLFSIHSIFRFSSSLLFSCLYVYFVSRRLSLVCMSSLFLTHTHIHLSPLFSLSLSFIQLSIPARSLSHTRTHLPLLAATAAPAATATTAAAAAAAAAAAIRLCLTTCAIDFLLLLAQCRAGRYMKRVKLMIQI